VAGSGEGRVDHEQGHHRPAGGGRVQAVRTARERIPADAIVVATLDRLTRSVKDFAMLLDGYFRAGCRGRCCPW
jgi:DNA invertase Pin-like site-specific DNA recombinase